MMKTIRRWTAGIVSSFDWVISQVENHEALVTSAIQDVQEAGARAKVQLSRVRRDGESLRRRLTELRDGEDLWRQRAVKLAQTDEKRALECVKRAKRHAKEIAELETQEREHAKLEKQLAADLAAIDARLGELNRQKNLMRTRESRAHVLAAIQKNDSNVISEIEGIFERWENKVAEYEILSEAQSSGDDDLATELSAQEEQEELRVALTEMLEEQGKR